MNFKTIHKDFLNNENIPWWLKVLNGINLIPLLIYPIVLIFSVFLMDNPNKIEALSSILLVNSYPFVLMSTVSFSFKLYQKSKTLLAILIPICISCLLILFIKKYILHG